MPIDCLTSRVARSATPVRRFIVAALAMGLPLVSHGQVAAVTRDAILRAEDARGNGPGGIAPILAGLQDPALRAISIRAIGRLERPELVRHIVPYFAEAPRRGIVAEALAQSLRGLPASAQRTPSDLALVDSVSMLLRSRVAQISGSATLRDIARSLGRLPFDQPRQAREVEAFLLGLPQRAGDRDNAEIMEGIAHGLYSLARARRTLGDFTPQTIAFLRGAAAYRRGDRGASAVRRPAWLALTASGGADRESIASAIAEDPDAQVRRLAVAALPNVQDSIFRREQLARAARDRDPMVRLEWVRVFRLAEAGLSGCGPLMAALTDPVPHVQLAAIDALGGSCPERDTVLVPLRVQTLRYFIETGPDGVTGRTARNVSWHARAHALVALARVDSANSSEILRRDSRHPVWQVRMYVARAAAAVRDSALLTSLAFDTVGSVREVAIQGLSATVGHLADLVYVRALSSPDYHVVLAAARALKGAPVRDSILPAALDALERLTREQRQTSRDPRMELLARVREMGDAQSAGRLRSLLTDVDPGVATEAAAVMNHLTGRQEFNASPTRTANSSEVPSGMVHVRVTMSGAGGDGTFDVALDADRAPMTVARIRGLIGRKYYDGLTFHRVVPNFVLQGGSPGMNEYVGDGPFMRDELSLAHHDRYTLGISTRGRDTGDAQWFINLVDNYRLDHEYTVIGRITRGFDLVDRILEGDVMESVRIVP
jgi:peptidyl-prolyl cis-trans isomerase B (cyclophilin B)